MAKKEPSLVGIWVGKVTLLLPQEPYLIRRALLYLGQKVGLGRMGEEQGMSDPDDGVGT